MLDDVELSPLDFGDFSSDLSFCEDLELRLTEAHLLPALGASWIQFSPFKVYAAWHHSGLTFDLSLSNRDLCSSLVLDVFVDTRDVKSSGYNSRFCHYFKFDLKEDSKAGLECTHFRSEDKHELSSPENLKVFYKKSGQKTRYKCIVAADALHGFDPLEGQRIGFTYRVTIGEEIYDYFSSSKDFNIEEQPSQWGSMRLVK